MMATLPAERLRWGALILLVAFGIEASISRMLAIAGHASVLTRAPLAIARWMFPAQAGEFQEMEAHLARTAPSTLVHVLAGCVFLAFGLMQFSSAIRTRHRTLHRRSGRILVIVAVIAGATGLWKGIVDPYSTTERLPTAVIGVAFLIAPAMAIAAIRSGDVARHREWMIRFFATGVSVAVIRLLSPLILWLMAPMNFHELVGTAFWAGWIVAQAAAELWIRHTSVAAQCRMRAA